MRDVIVTPRFSSENGHSRWDMDLTYRHFGVIHRMALFNDYELSESTPRPDTDDTALLAGYFPALRFGRRLIVEGTVSAFLARNLEYLSHQWAQDCPGRYHPITIEATKLDTREPGAEGRARNLPAICVFSGGVDSLYTALRAVSREPQADSPPLGTLLFVLGLDIPMSERKVFDTLANRYRTFFAQWGVSLTTATTNVKSASKQHWEHSFGAVMASLLHGLSATHSSGWIPGDEPIEARGPWGSLPELDHFYSSPTFPISHENADLYRTQKLEFISSFPGAVNLLRFCWEGPRPGENCGVCEKCIRTRLAMRVAGIDDAVLFAEPLTPSAITRLNLSSPPRRISYEKLLELAADRGVKEPWMSTLHSAVESAQKKGRRRSQALRG